MLTWPNLIEEFRNRRIIVEPQGLQPNYATLDKRECFCVPWETLDPTEAKLLENAAEWVANFQPPRDELHRVCLTAQHALDDPLGSSPQYRDFVVNQLRDITAHRETADGEPVDPSRFQAGFFGLRDFKGRPVLITDLGAHRRFGPTHVLQAVDLSLEYARRILYIAGVAEQIVWVLDARDINVHTWSLAQIRLIAHLITRLHPQRIHQVCVIGDQEALQRLIWPLARQLVGASVIDSKVLIVESLQALKSQMDIVRLGDLLDSAPLWPLPIHATDQRTEDTTQQPAEPRPAHKPSNDKLPASEQRVGDLVRFFEADKTSGSLDRQSEGSVIPSNLLDLRGERISEISVDATEPSPSDDLPDTKSASLPERSTSTSGFLAIDNQWVPLRPLDPPVEMKTPILSSEFASSQSSLSSTSDSSSVESPSNSSSSSSQDGGPDAVCLADLGGQLEGELRDLVTVNAGIQETDSQGRVQSHVLEPVMASPRHVVSDRPFYAPTPVLPARGLVDPQSIKLPPGGELIRLQSLRSAACLPAEVEVSTFNREDDSPMIYQFRKQEAQAARVSAAVPGGEKSDVGPAGGCLNFWRRN